MRLQHNLVNSPTIHIYSSRRFFMKETIILDTSIYRSLSLSRSAEIEALNKLIKFKHIQIFIPFIVYNEYLSDLKVKFEESRKLLKNQIKTIGKFLHKNLNEKNQFLKIIEEINFDQDNDFNLWISSNNISVAGKLDINPSIVLHEYFEGKAPYRGIKTREDIPDSLIYHEIMNYFERTKENIIFICNDKRLREAFANTSIITHVTLKEYVQKPETINVLTTIKQTFLNTLYKFLIEHKDNLIDSIENDLVNKVYSTEIESHSIPSDDNIGTIASVEYIDPDTFKIIENSLYSYGDNLYIFDIELTLDVLVDFYIYKADYYCLEEKFYIEDHSDHYYSAQKSITLNSTADIKINISIDEEDDSLEIDKLEVNTINFNT